MPENSRQLAAIMFTDIVGYTALMGSDEQKALELLRKNRELQKPLIEKYRGKWIKEIGDGVLAQFSSALDAVKCSLSIQNMANTEFEGQIRIGIHLGDITTENDDIFGDGVNISSRLQSIADPGGIYISESVYEAIRGRSDIQVQYLGEIQLKNVDHPVKTYYLQEEGLPVPSIRKMKDLSKSNRKTIPVSTVSYILTIIALLAGGWWTWSTFTSDSPNSIESIAVLPFSSLTDEADQEYFIAGMHDALISELSKISALHIISKQSTKKYKHSEMSISEIADELGVDALLEGSAFGQGDSMRIQVRLIEARPEERNIWNETYNLAISNVLTMYSEISQTIAKEINVKLTPQEESLFASTRQVNPETYKAYLRGMYYLNQYTSEGFEKGMAYLNKAIEIDPADPLAYAGLALGYSLLGHGPDPPEDAYIRAKAAALRALELDPSLAEAHASIAQIKLYQDWEWDAAKKAFQYALSFNSSLADTRAHYSWYLQLFGQTEEALAEMKRAKEADPLTPLWSAWLGWQLWNAGQFDEAINEANKSFELDADFTVGFFVAGSAYASKGMFEEAIKLHKRAGEIDPNWKFALALTYAMAGQNDEAEKILAELEAAYSTWNTLFIAQIYSVLGDKDKAFQWIEEAYEKPSHPYMPWIKNMPAFKRLQNDTRFNELLQRMNLPVIEDPIM